MISIKRNCFFLRKYLFLSSFFCWKWLWTDGNLCKKNCEMFAKVFIHWSIVTYTDACRNIVNKIMMNEHTSLEKYSSHILFEMVAKGLQKGYVWEVSWRLNRDCNILTPSSSIFSSTSFSFCGAAQPGVLRAPLCWELVLTASNCNKLTPTNWTCLWPWVI